MTTPCLLSERQGCVARVVLNRPHVLNAIDADLCDALMITFQQLESDPRVRVVVISGNGPKGFCAGADLTYMRTLEGAALSRFIEKTWHCFEKIHQSPLPTIAALHGHVLGGGLELALACDFRLADASASLGLPEMTLGSVPGSGAMQRLPKLIGESRTLAMAALGKRMTAHEALTQGVINDVCTDQTLNNLSIQWAEQLAQRPPEALRYAKTAMRTRHDPAVAAAFHGLVSASCHRDRQYKAHTQRFGK